MDTKFGAHISKYASSSAEYQSQPEELDDDDEFSTALVLVGVIVMNFAKQVKDDGLVHLAQILDEQA